MNKTKLYKKSKSHSQKLKVSALKIFGVEVDPRKKEFRTQFNKVIQIKRKKPVKKIKKFYFLSLVISLSSVMFILAISILLMTYLKSRVQGIPSIDSIFTNVPVASEIYDRNGVRLFRLHNDTSNTDLAVSEEINPYTIAAFIAAEDAEFYNHDGISVEGILRCTTKIITNDDICGGSTITQQLVKIRTNQSQLSFERKIDEILLATQIEDSYSKDKILTLYLNVTPYGSNIVGIKAASKFYFGIENISDLTLDQAVTLAAIVNNPAHLSPTLSLDKDNAIEMLKEREDYIYEQLSEKVDIINQQLENKFNQKDIISQKLINTSKNTVHEFKEPIIEIKAGHFVNYTTQVLLDSGNKYGRDFTLKDLQTGGYKIYTSLDYNMQQVAEKYASQGGNDYKYANVHNAALMTVDPKTGEVLTMAGSKSYTGESEGCDRQGKNCKYDPEVNILTSYQQPGSTNKPLGYAIAFSQGKIYPESYLPDVPIRFGNYIPKNWDGKFMGPYHTAKEMLRRSRNIPALQVMNMIGVDTYIDTAEKFGYTTYTDRDNLGLSLILGGGDVYPVEHVQAYSVFANGGVKVDINPIMKIEDPYGNIIYQAEPNPKKIADPSGIYLLNQSLYRLETGIGTNTIAWDDRDISGKTGTTEDNKDALLMIYSPDFVTFGWAGNNNNEPLSTVYGWPGLIVSPWITSYMSELSQMGYFNEKTPFYKPNDPNLEAHLKCLNNTCEIEPINENDRPVINTQFIPQNDTYVTVLKPQ